MKDIRFEDEASNASESTPSSGEETKIRCRKCRTVLASKSFIAPHAPKLKSTSACGHIFLHPISWMRPALSTPDPESNSGPAISFTSSSSSADDYEISVPGPMSGRLTCPNAKCGGTNIGKFAWQGMKCTCGEWITPAFALARGRVDEAGAKGAIEIRKPIMANNGGGKGKI